MVLQLLYVPHDSASDHAIVGKLTCFDSDMKTYMEKTILNFNIAIYIGEERQALC